MPIFDWSSVPDRATHLAMDGDGKWYWYSCPPDLDYAHKCWGVTMPHHIYGPVPLGPLPRTLWMNSLIERPVARNP